MSKENPNDNSHWKLKLDSVCLQEPILLDKEAAWDKLQQRLYQEPVQKERAWYWAAAIVLVLFSIPFLIRKIKPVPVVSVKTTESYQTLRLPGIEQTNNKEGKLLLHPAVSQKTNLIIALEKTRHLYHKKRMPEPLVKPAFVSAVSPAKTPHSVSIASLHSIDSVTTIAIISSTPGRKLKTVHINELEPPADRMASFKSRNGSYSDIRFGNRMMNTAPVVQSSDHSSIFKIKF